jgi:hypothetical protein
VGLCRVFGLPVQAWNWERMFRGEETGKGRTTAGELPQTMRYGAALVEGKEPEPDCGVGLVIGHEALLERLAELETAAETEEKTVEIKAWQDTETGLWGLRRGRKRLTEAVYVRVFGVKDKVAAKVMDKDKVVLVVVHQEILETVHQEILIIKQQVMHRNQQMKQRKLLIKRNRMQILVKVHKQMPMLLKTPLKMHKMLLIELKIVQIKEIKKEKQKLLKKLKTPPIEQRKLLEKTEKMAPEKMEKIVMEKTVLEKMVMRVVKKVNLVKVAEKVMEKIKVQAI